VVYTQVNRWWWRGELAKRMRLTSETLEVKMERGEASHPGFASVAPRLGIFSRVLLGSTMPSKIDVRDYENSLSYIFPKSGPDI
jgi:hypothetical protein